MEGSEAVTAAIAEELSEAMDRSFFSKGALLPSLLGPAKFATRSHVYWSGEDTFHVTFRAPGLSGMDAGVWTTEAGLEALIGDLQASLITARLAKGTQ